jgi:phosphoglycerate dehydrogenase-like enzyme
MTQHTTEISTVLVYLLHAKLAPTLVQDLESTYDSVIWKLDGAEPSTQDLKDADVIFGLTIPKELKSIDQVPNLKLYQAVSAGFSHITSTDFFKGLPETSDLMFSNSSGIHVSTIGEHCLATVLM